MLRVLTLNIWNLGGVWRDRRDAIVGVLAEHRPDIVCLQEVVASDRGHQAEWIASQLGGWSVAFAGEGPSTGSGLFGNAIISRWPIETTSSRALPYVDDPTEIQRLVLHARTDGIDVFCTHLAWQLHDAALRERQVLDLMAFVDAETDPDSPLGPIVAGDFNAEPDSTAVRYLTGLASLDGRSTYLQDAWRLAGDGGPGFTWMNHNPHAAVDAEPERRLDYIFSAFHGPGGTGRPVECLVVADQPVDGVWPSDHFGVSAVFQR